MNAAYSSTTPGILVMVTSLPRPSKSRAYTCCTNSIKVRCTASLAVQSRATMAPALAANSASGQVATMGSVFCHDVTHVRSPLACPSAKPLRLTWPTDMTSAAIFSKSARACTSNRFTVSATGTCVNNMHPVAIAATGLLVNILLQNSLRVFLSHTKMGA